MLPVRSSSVGARVGVIPYANIDIRALISAGGSLINSINPISSMPAPCVLVFAGEMSFGPNAGAGRDQSPLFEIVCLVKKTQQQRRKKLLCSIVRLP